MGYLMKKSLAVGVFIGEAMDIPVCAFAAKSKKYWTAVDPVDCGENAQWPWARAYCVKPKAGEMSDFNKLLADDDDDDDDDDFERRDYNNDDDDDDDDDNDDDELVDLLKKALRNL